MATDRLAEEIRQRALFAEVRACFWKEEPFLSLDLVSARRVYVVPNFAGEGVFTRRLIPEKLSITGTLTTVAGRQLIYTEAVGSHPRMATLLRQRALRLCRAEEIDPAAAALLIIGHGSRQPGITSATPEAVAAAIRQAGGFGEVVTAYIEQDPRVSDWPRMTAAKTLIAAPLLVSQGMHASEDLPPLFGLTAPWGGPARMADRTCWLMGGIGSDAEVVDLILDQIRRAEAEAGMPMIAVDRP